MLDFLAQPLNTVDLFWGAMRLSIFVLEVVYLFFAFLIVRQVSLMNKSVTTPASVLFTFVSYAHFFAVGVLLILSWLSF
ncbi:MAG: DUF5657 family protein [Patescibacteria group bacterium]